MAATKKTATKKPVAKKVMAKKTVAAKVVAKKVVAKKVVAKKPVAKKPVAKKPVAKKVVAKKPVAKKPAPVPAANWNEPEKPLDLGGMDGRGERAPTIADISGTSLGTSVKALEPGATGAWGDRPPTTA